MTGLPSDEVSIAARWDIFSASNHICVAVDELSKRTELTEAERVKIEIAARILSDASGDILTRTRAAAKAEGKAVPA